MASWLSSGVVPVAAAVILVGIGCGRIVSTYRIFSPTFDEPDHLAAGMEWLSRGRYNYEPKHPPLERIAGALPLWIEGVRTVGASDPYREGRLLLSSRGQFQHDLALARSGVLIFFVVTCVVVFSWSRSLFGPWVALVCLFEFTLVPTVLGHSGLITTDSAAMATIPLCLLTFLWCIEAPSGRRVAVAGVCLALAVLGKFSALPFLAAFAATWAVLNCLNSGRLYLPVRVTATGTFVFVLTAFLTLWAGYGFRSEPLSAASKVRAWRDRLRSDSTLHRLELQTLDVPLPAGNLIRGLGGLLAHEQGQVLQYFRGEVSANGWPLFFPIGLAVKTPLPFLVLALAGVVLALRFRLPKGDLTRVYPAAFSLAMLLVCIPARINLGTRHILPIYPLLAVGSGLAIQATWRAKRHRSVLRAMVAVLLLWLTTESVLAHPDYIAYFNQLAGHSPETLLVESDLDWGQDLIRLKDKAADLRIDNLHLAYYGPVPPEDCGLTRYTKLQDNAPVAGWAAVSLHQLVFQPSKYAWLGRYPWQPIGKSIRLYYVPEPVPPITGALSRNLAMAELGLR